MPAKLTSESVCLEPISKSALYQGTTSVVPKRANRTRALAPAELFSYRFRLRTPLIPHQSSVPKPSSVTSLRRKKPPPAGNRQIVRVPVTFAPDSPLLGHADPPDAGPGSNR